MPLQPWAKLVQSVVGLCNPSATLMQSVVYVILKTKMVKLIYFVMNIHLIIKVNVCVCGVAPRWQGGGR